MWVKMSESKLTVSVQATRRLDGQDDIVDLGREKLTGHGVVAWLICRVMVEH